MARVIRAHKTGGPEVMQLDDVQLPAPGAGQALVRIEAAGVNFIDIYQRSGQYQLPLPLALGVEAAGVVEQVGSVVSDLRVGGPLRAALRLRLRLRLRRGAGGEEQGERGRSHGAGSVSEANVP